MKTFTAILVLILALATARAEHEGKIQILLLGDSTTDAKIPRRLAPNEPQLEDLIRTLLAAEGDLPSVNVINSGLSGEYIRRLLDSGRYDKEAAKLPGLDYILVRYGLNDHDSREAFEFNFQKDYRELLTRLRSDHPQATVILVTVIPFLDEPTSFQINCLIRQVADEEKLTFFDIYSRYAAELRRGPDMLNYRRLPVAQIPEKLRAFAKPYVMGGKDPTVVVLDNRLDAHFGNIPDWFADRHPNLAGYHVIADETVKLLAPLIRAQSGKAKK
ncbi:MAG: SGNH/GDSL hydrolase family protein [Pseudolabrys sp.]|nr:SGNH/GDSL hydrolase family protein [Pseudolabrys sp.]